MKTKQFESFKKILPEFEAAGVICSFAISLCLQRNQKSDNYWTEKTKVEYILIWKYVRGYHNGGGLGIPIEIVKSF